MNNSKLDRRAVLKLAAATTTVVSSTDATQARSVSENKARIRAKLGQTDSTVLKRTAAADYRTSLARFGGQLANSPDELLRDTQSIDVVVIGSGYGGSILAARLAPRLYPGRRLIVLERGRECLPGTFPDTLRGCVADLRQRPFSSAALSLKNPLGLLDLCSSPDINVISGSGLGGTSLVNANVAAVPDRDVFAQDPWPRVFHDATELDLGFRLAAYELNLQYSPCDTAKTKALARIGQSLNIPSEPALVAVTHQGRGLSANRRNRQGMLQRPCTMCGDCATGCNVGAKNTLQMNYLPLAKSFGAEMYPQTEVRSIHKTSAGYCVEFVQWISTENGLTQRRGRVFAKMVILAAGSIGSTELLLRSQTT
ncbi:MAG: GMC family oxidoreductase N-terminal domain-containing protein, partial [Pirellulaceae bacterium]